MINFKREQKQMFSPYLKPHIRLIIKYLDLFSWTLFRKFGY